MSVLTKKEDSLCGCYHRDFQVVLLIVDDYDKGKLFGSMLEWS